MENDLGKSVLLREAIKLVSAIVTEYQQLFLRVPIACKYNKILL